MAEEVEVVGPLVVSARNTIAVLVYNLGEDRTTAARRRGANELGYVVTACKRPRGSSGVSPGHDPAAAVAFSSCRTVVLLGYNDGRLAWPAIAASAPALLNEVVERLGQADVDDEPYV